MSGRQTPRREAQVTLMDILIVFVVDGAILIFLFWLAFRVTNERFIEDLPPWIIGSYGYFTALAAGGAGLGALVIDNFTRRTRRPNYLKLFAGSLLGALLLLLVIRVTVAVVNQIGVRLKFGITQNEAPSAPPPPVQTQQQQPSPFAKAFKSTDVSRLGTMREIQVTVTGATAPPSYGTFILEYKWTGSGGTQNGSQGFSLLFKGKDGVTLDSIPFQLDRSHCYYGGGNYEQKPGILKFDPRLIEGIEIKLNEVVGKMGLC